MAKRNAVATSKGFDVSGKRRRRTNAAARGSSGSPSISTGRRRVHVPSGRVGLGDGKGGLATAPSVRIELPSQVPRVYRRQPSEGLHGADLTVAGCRRAGDEHPLGGGLPKKHEATPAVRSVRAAALLAEPADKGPGDIDRTARADTSAGMNETRRTT